MRTMAANSIDCIITDPPYGLHFMGKDWDHGIPGKHFWEEAFRICKPGAHLLAFGGDRTHHHLMNALEQAGWEIRTCLYWCFGQGFPKSHNFGCKCTGDNGSQGRLCDGTSISDGQTPQQDIAKDRSGSSQRSQYQEQCNRESGTVSGQSNTQTNRMGTCEKCDGIKGFEGYGTALKPAVEIIIMAMKPCEGTFAQNAEKWGVAGINIDGCRIGTSESLARPFGSGGIGCKQLNAIPSGTITGENLTGRWPANLLLDEEAAELLDQQSGNLKSGKPGSRKKEWVGYAKGLKILAQESGFGDSGGASRFFYCAKASSAERNAGLDKPSVHPTVKPLALMQYLIKLIMPPNPEAVLLDPFAGSGTTIVAAKQLGRSAVGIEISEDYFEIAENRLRAAKEPELDLFGFEDRRQQQ